MSEEQDRGSLDEFERALSGLQPRKAAVDRDRLMFLAGQAAAQRSRGSSKFWPAATVMVALVAGGLGHFSGSRTVSTTTTAPSDRSAIASGDSHPTGDNLRPTRNVTLSIAARPEAQPFGGASYSSDPLAYINLRHSVARWGVDALPIASSTNALHPVTSYRRLRQQMSNNGLDGSTPTKPLQDEDNRI